MAHELTPTEHFIIHGAALAAAGVGGGLARLPGADAPVLVSLQSAMVTAIAEHRGVSLTRAAAVELVLTMLATMTGRTLAGGLVRLLPGMGEVINAATAAAVTEAVGLAASQWCRRAAVVGDCP